MTDIKELKKKYVIDIDSFKTAKQNYHTFCNTIDNPNYSVEKSKEAFETFINKFEHIFRICATESKIKETAKIYLSEQKSIIPKVAFTGDITNIDFTIGYFGDFYIVTRLDNPHNIKFMKDEFWTLLYKLSTIGEFEFKEIEMPTKGMRKKAPQLFKKTGNYYKLLRNYFLYEYEYANIRQLGYIGLSWDTNTPFDVLIPNFCEAFKIMYQLNFLLWRQDNKNTKL